VLAAWAITESGQKCCWVSAAAKDDSASCRDFLRDLKARGLQDPLLVATDGAPGLTRAVEEIFPARSASGVSPTRSATLSRRCPCCLT